MLFYLAKWLAVYHRSFTVFHYITLRCILGALTALLIAWLIGPMMIRKLLAYQIGQPIRSDGPQNHLQKVGTPTMGGVLILVAVILATLLWADLGNHYIWLVGFATVSFGWIGFRDDYLKLVLKNSRGLVAWKKMLYQLLGGVGIVVGLMAWHPGTLDTQLLIPFFKQLFVDLGWFYLPFVCLVIVGTSNAVNLTDGLDGLAILPAVMIAGALGVFAYVGGNFNFARYLLIPYVPGVGELAVFCSAIGGAGLGFLWFNTYPAQIFMGDVGALGLGAALGTVAVMVRQELILLLMGGIFVVETISVIMQVASFKLTGKRIFRMAPLHHHFELKGWPEPRIIVRFWIITWVLIMLGLASLKIR